MTIITINKKGEWENMNREEVRNIEIYFLRDNKIYKGVIVKPSKRGTAAWVKVDNKSKLLLVSLCKCFKTRKEADKELNRKNKIKINKKDKLKQEQREIDIILERIYKRFGIEIRFLDRPVLLEEAKELEIKLNNRVINS